MKVAGTIIKFADVQKGTTQAGKEWVKQNYVIDTGEEYNNILAFEVFGQEKVDKLTAYNKVGDKVHVEFNIQCNEWKDKFFTTLQSWQIKKAVASQEVDEAGVYGTLPEGDGLPF